MSKNIQIERNTGRLISADRDELLGRSSSETVGVADDLPPPLFLLFLLFLLLLLGTLGLKWIGF